MHRKNSWMIGKQCDIPRGWLGFVFDYAETAFHCWFVAQSAAITGL